MACSYLILSVVIKCLDLPDPIAPTTTRRNLALGDTSALAAAIASALALSIATPLSVAFLAVASILRSAAAAALPSASQTGMWLRITGSVFSSAIRPQFSLSKGVCQATKTWYNQPDA